MARELGLTESSIHEVLASRDLDLVRKKIAGTAYDRLMKTASESTSRAVRTPGWPA